MFTLSSEHVQQIRSFFGILPGRLLVARPKDVEYKLGEIFIPIEVRRSTLHDSVYGGGRIVVQLAQVIGSEGWAKNHYQVGDYVYVDATAGLQLDSSDYDAIPKGLDVRIYKEDLFAEAPLKVVRETWEMSEKEMEQFKEDVTKQLLRSGLVSAS
jgi:hypothetical protein